MILAIDTGNTYIKYKVWGSGEVLSVGRILPEEIETLPLLMSRYQITKVAFASVGGDSIKQRLHNLFEVPEFHHIQSTHYCLGVTNGYIYPEMLGVDRWLAIIEAYHLSGKNSCAVFDLGTALTLDIVNKNGQHLGGYIAPGLAMMRESLLKNTEKVRFKPQNSINIGYGRTTVDAVENGTWSLVIAWIKNEISQFRITYPSGMLYITGGLAESIIPYVENEAEYREDLVLDGLQRVVSS